MPKKILCGTVIKKKMDKTISVLVDRYIKHPKYHKMVKRSKRYAVHDAYNEYREGEMVKIIESNPLSKTKRWTVYKKRDVSV